MENNTTNPNNSETKSEHKVENKEEQVNLPIDRSRMMKIGLIAAAVLVVLGLLFAFKSLFLAAMVDGHFISRHAVVSELERQGGKDTLDNLIDKQLITAEAKSKNITITEDELNEEMKKFEDQFSAVGQSLDEVLAMENLSRDNLKDQIRIRKMIEKLIGDKVNISDEDLNKNITDSQITLPAGQEEETKNQIREQMKQDKLAELSLDLIKDLRSKAKIYTFVEYKGGAPTE